MTGAVDTGAEEKERTPWIRPKVGESCWVDVGLQLIDENGQLEHERNVRSRSEAHRYTANSKRVADRVEQHRRFSLPKTDRPAKTPQAASRGGRQ